MIKNPPAPSILVLPRFMLLGAKLVILLLMGGFLEYVNPKRDKMSRLKEPTGISTIDIYKNSKAHTLKY